MLGVTWYTEENLAHVKSTATDPERFEATYAEWNAMACEALADIKKLMASVVKFPINSNEFLAWCSLHSKPNNAATRAELVAEKVRLQHEPSD